MKCKNLLTTLLSFGLFSLASGSEKVKLVDRETQINWESIGRDLGENIAKKNRDAQIEMKLILPPCDLDEDIAKNYSNDKKPKSEVAVAAESRRKIDFYAALWRKCAIMRIVFSFLGPALTRVICVNSEIGVRLICADIGDQIGKMPMFLWGQKPTVKSIGSAAEYIDFDRQSKSFSFNSDKIMEEYRSIAATSEDGFGHVGEYQSKILIFFHCFYIIISGAMNCFMCSIIIKYYIIDRFSSPFWANSVIADWGWFGLIVNIFIFIIFCAFELWGILFMYFQIFPLFEYLAKVMKLRNVERNVFSGVKYYLKEGNEINPLLK